MNESREPFISIITPVYKSDPQFLTACIESVLNQQSDNWEMILVDDCSQDENVDLILAKYASDPRFKIHVRETNGGIAEASNDALNLAVGKYVGMLDHDDVLHKEATKFVEQYAESNPTAEILYSDRQVITAEGKLKGAFRKAIWSPENFRNNMYICHFTVVSREAALAVEGFRQEFVGSQDHDLVLRIFERDKPVIHIPKVLYYWRSHEGSTGANPDAKPYARENGLRAVQQHCDRTGINATAVHTKNAGFYNLVRVPPPDTKVSVIIPTCGTEAVIFGTNRCLVVEAVRSVLSHDYQVDVELIVVYDNRGDLAYLDELRAIGGDRLQLVRFDEEFNFSRKCNIGALHATGDVLVLLNDDTEVITPRWLDQLASLALDEGVGVVAPKMYFENGLIMSTSHTVQRGGVWNSERGTFDGGGYYGSSIVDHEVIGVSGACMAIATSRYFEVGGLSEYFHNSFNDVDFQTKLVRRGYRNMAATSVSIFHYESLSRDHEVASMVGRKLTNRWAHLLNKDPYTYTPAAKVSQEAIDNNLKALADGRRSHYFPPIPGEDDANDI